jgi:simple sugar transport system ATP-binding protein
MVNLRYGCEAVKPLLCPWKPTLAPRNRVRRRVADGQGGSRHTLQFRHKLPTGAGETPGKESGGMTGHAQVATARIASAEVLLSLRGITKSFGAVRALNGVDLDIAPGEVLGLMGDNGAGKSTLTKIIAGNFPPTQGQIALDGGAVAFDRPAAARDAGIEVMYQDLAISENLTAAANIFLGREVTWRVGPLRFLDHRAMNHRAAELFRELKSETRADDLVKQMSGGQRQAVAIARTRLAKAKLVLMDEPTAAISVRQVAEVLDLIRRLRDGGTAVMLISHRMPDVFTVCDRVAVLRRGLKVADKPVATTSPEEVTGLITGAIEAA